MQGTGKVSLCASVGEGRGDVKPAKNADRFTMRDVQLLLQDELWANNSAADPAVEI